MKTSALKKFLKLLYGVYFHCSIFIPTALIVCIQQFCICKAQFHCRNGRKIEGWQQSFVVLEKAQKLIYSLKDLEEGFWNRWAVPFLYLFFGSCWNWCDFLIRNGSYCASMVPWKITRLLSVIFDFSVVRLSPIVFT